MNVMMDKNEPVMVDKSELQLMSEQYHEMLRKQLYPRITKFVRKNLLVEINEAFYRRIRRYIKDNLINIYYKTNINCKSFVISTSYDPTFYKLNVVIVMANKQGNTFRYTFKVSLN